MKIKTKTSIPLKYLAFLALLAMPRVVMHDLRIVAFDSPVYRFWALGPILVWLVYALVAKTKRPFYDFLVLGLLFGLFLAVTHQITWDTAWNNNPPTLGGNLEGKLDPAIESILIRLATFMSSLFTGLVAGVLLGAIATIRTKLRPQSTKKS